MFGNNGGGLFTGLASLFIIVAILAGAAVLGFSDQAKQRAEAERVQAETEWENRLRELEYPYLQQEREAEARAQAAKIEAETAAELAQVQEAQRIERERHNQQLRMEAMLRNALVLLLLFLGFIVILAVGLGVVRILQILLPKPEQDEMLQPVRQPGRIDPLRDDQRYREWRIAQARRQERETRILAQAPSYPHRENGSGRTRRSVYDPPQKYGRGNGT